MESTSFQTADKPDAVRSFYMNALLADGWRLEKGSAPDKLEFYWIDGCPVHGMDVILGMGNGGQTDVELVSTADECM